MERKEPTIGSVDTSTKDKASSASPARSQSPEKSASAPRRKASSVQQPQAASGGSWVATIALLLAFAALGGSGYLAWQLQQSSEALSSAELRIVELESKLELSDDESSASVTALQAKLKWADSEIRKLWGVSYDTNRKTINAHKSKLATLDKSVASLRKDVKAAKSGADSALNKVGSQVTALKTLSEQVAADKVRYDKSLGNVDTQRQQAQRTADDLNRLKQQLATLNADINVRVQDNEEAIDAIDKHRLTINREILQLQQRLNSQNP